MMDIERKKKTENNENVAEMKDACDNATPATRGERLVSGLCCLRCTRVASGWTPRYA